MQSKTARLKKSGTANQPVLCPKNIASEAAQIAVNEHCLLHYGTSYSGGIPQRLSLPKTEVWVVPIVMTSPGYGVVGQAGMAAIDALTGTVIGATPQDEVWQAGKRLALEKRHELDAAFRRARTV